MNATDIRTCECCSKTGPVAEDETNPGTDEMAIDCLGLVVANEYVCGECLTDAEDGIASK